MSCPHELVELVIKTNNCSMLALEDVYDVTVVKDGQEAYDTVRANMEEGKAFDLIFMDIQVGIQVSSLAYTTSKLISLDAKP